MYLTILRYILHYFYSKYVYVSYDLPMYLSTAPYIERYIGRYYILMDRLIDR